MRSLVAAFFVVFVALVALGDPPGIASVFDAAAVSGAEVVLPCGRYELKDTIKIGPASGLTVRGCGAPFHGTERGTVLVWTGEPGKSMFELAAVREAYFGDFTVQGGNLGTAIESYSVKREGGLLSTNITFERINIVAVDYGFRLTDPNGIDANNDMHKFLNCSIVGVRKVGISVENGQSKGLLIQSGSVVGDQTKTGVYGLKSVGSQTVRNWAGGSLDTMIHAHPNDELTIENLNVEHAKRLLYIPGNTTMFSVRVKGVRFSMERVAEDGKFMVIGTPGPTVIEGIQLGGTLNPQAQPPRIALHTWTTRLSARVYGLNLSGSHPSGVHVHTAEYGSFHANPGMNKGPWGRVNVGGVYRVEPYSKETGYELVAP